MSPDWRSWLRGEIQTEPALGGQQVEPGWEPLGEWVACENEEAQYHAARALRELCLQAEAQTGRRTRILVTVDERVMRGEVPTDVD